MTEPKPRERPAPAKRRRRRDGIVERAPQEDSELETYERPASESRDNPDDPRPATDRTPPD